MSRHTSSRGISSTIRPTDTRVNWPLKCISDWANMKKHAASSKFVDTAGSHTDQPSATATPVTRPVMTAICAPNVKAPRAKPTIRASCAHSEITAKNDIALKMTASVPNAAGSMWRDDNANMANANTDAVNLIVSTAALPFGTSFDGSASAILLTIVTGRTILVTTFALPPSVKDRHALSGFEPTIADF